MLTKTIFYGSDVEIGNIKFKKANGNEIDESEVKFYQLQVYTPLTSQLSRILIDKNDASTSNSRYVNGSIYLAKADLQNLQKGQITIEYDLELTDTNFTDGTFDSVYAESINYYLSDGSDSDIPTTTVQELTDGIIANRDAIKIATNEISILADTKADASALSVYAKIKDVDASLAKKADTSVLNDYAKKVDVYTKTEIEAKGYLTEHQDLSEYAKKADVDASLSEKANSSDLENYALKTDIPEAANLTPYAKIEDVDASLANKADKSEIPTNISAFNNDAEYVTETELNDKGYLTEHQDLSEYALKSEIPAEKDLSEYAKIADVDASLSEYAKKTEIPAEQDLSDYITREQLDASLANIKVDGSDVSISAYSDDGTGFVKYTDFKDDVFTPDASGKIRAIYMNYGQSKACGWTTGSHEDSLVNYFSLARYVRGFVENNLLNQIKTTVVQELPATGNTGVVYFINVTNTPTVYSAGEEMAYGESESESTTTDSSVDKYDVYVYSDGFVKIGSTNEEPDNLMNVTGRDLTTEISPVKSDVSTLNDVVFDSSIVTETISYMPYVVYGYDDNKSIFKYSNVFALDADVVFGDNYNTEYEYGAEIPNLTFTYEGAEYECSVTFQSGPYVGDTVVKIEYPTDLNKAQIVRNPKNYYTSTELGLETLSIQQKDVQKTVTTVSVASKTELSDVSTHIDNTDKTAAQAIAALQASIPTVPTKVSELDNDSAYVTSEQLDASIAAISVPSKTSELTNDSDFVTSEQLDASLAAISVPSKTSELSNDSGYMTTISGLNVSELRNDASYVTEEVLESKNYLTIQDITQTEYDALTDDEKNASNIIYRITD